MAGFPQVPGYEIRSELGRGGMAVVYSAIETGLDREVAIKIVSADAGDPEGHIQRLENEARGLAALHHPHIVDLYRFGRLADGSLYYVMPLLPGGSLEDWAKPVGEEHVVALLENLLDALGHAHAMDIVHRDIKPANILFDRHKRPLLADFGAAFMRKRDTRITDHGVAIGSSGYMSPEQARGQEVDARSDLYSTAVLAFELLTGKRPWDGPDELSTALAQIEQPVPRMPEALRHWQAFFYRALAVNPEHRYPNVAAMRAAIRALRPATPANARRRNLGIAIAAGVVLLGGLAFATWRFRAPREMAAPPSKPIVVPAVGVLPELIDKPVAAVGARFSDPGGPELVLAKLGRESRPGLAVMAAPVDRTLYRRFARSRDREPVNCTNLAAPAQGCLNLATAEQLARWLSGQTGQRYRVPTRAELEATIAQVSTSPGYAWTSTCRQARVARSRNVVQRSWAGIRKLVGKPKPVEYELRCDGYYTLKLDGRGGELKARHLPAPEAVVVLVREMTREKGRK